MSEIILDTETTGLSVKEDHRILEIACIETENLIPTKKVFYKLINPGRDISPDAIKIHGYTNEVLKADNNTVNNPEKNKLEKINIEKEERQD